mgnify:CR=1 FL=1
MDEKNIYLYTGFFYLSMKLFNKIAKSYLLLITLPYHVVVVVVFVFCKKLIIKQTNKKLGYKKEV